MTIAVNTRFLIKDKLEGIGWFTYEMLKRIVQNHPEHHFIFLFDRPYDESFIFGNNVEPIKVWPPARHPILWYYWFEIAIPKVLRNKKIDLFLSPDGFTSLSLKAKKLTVIHDIAFEHYPEHVPASACKFYKRNTPLYAQQSDKIVTVSEFSKADIVQKYDIRPDKIEVIYNGVSEVYQPISEAKKKEIKAQYSQEKDYFIFVSSLHPRKNPLGLLKAFEQFKHETNTDMKLLIAGRKAWSNKELEKYYQHMTYQSDVNFIGHCTQEKLAQILGAAYALVYPSFFEGFGIPLIEAMRCEVPVITSGVSSMQEVGKEAALLTDPDRHETIASAMKQLITSEILKSKLILNGKKRAAQFSWDQAASQLWNTVHTLS